MNKYFKGYILVMCSAILYGLMPLGAKIIYANGVDHFSLVFYRNFLLLPLLFVLLKLRGESLSISVSDELHILPVSLMGLCITPSLLYASYNYISSGMATTLHFVYPAFVTLGNFLFLREKLQRSHVLSVLLCTVGAALFYSPGGSFHPLGVGLALLSAVSMATYVLLLGKYRISGISSTKLCFYMCLNTSALALPVCLLSGGLAVPANALCWVACFIFSVLISFGAVNLFQQGSFIIGGQRASILSTFEPITSLIVGVLVFQEALTAGALLGAVLIISATALVALSDIRASAKN